MGLKSLLMDQGMKLLQDPRFGKLASDPRVMKAVVQAISLPAKVQEIGADTVAQLTKRLNLASEEEVAQLRRTVRRLEEEVARAAQERREE